MIVERYSMQCDKCGVYLGVDDLDPPRSKGIAFPTEAMARDTATDAGWTTALRVAAWGPMRGWYCPKCHV
jgi:hypothetical protein